MTTRHGSFALVLLLAACGTPPQVELTEATAEAEKADAVSSLTDDQAKTVLRVIDNTCGDTWCDGDFDFRFKKIVCQPARNSCTMLTFDTYPAFSDQKPSYYWRSCRMVGFSKYEDLINTAPTGYQSLTEGFYDAVSDCIQKIEGSIPR
jgi:hypothetical protein